MSVNWVMVEENGRRPFVPLPNERAVIASPARTSFALKSPKPPTTTTTSSSSTTSPSSASTQPVDLNIPTGIAYLTTRRLVYLPANPTPSFTSFSAPLLNLHDTRVTAPYFGPNVLVAAVQPVRDGGLPTPEHPPYMLELRLTFKDGGAYDLHQKFCELRERLVQAREIVREIGGDAGTMQHMAGMGEQLPAYEETGGGAGGGGRGGGSGGGSDATGVGGIEEHAQVQVRSQEEASVGPTSVQPEGAPPGYDEPPPGYEEAQQGR